MKKTAVAILAVFGAGAMVAQASVTFGHTTEQDSYSKSLTVSDLNNTPPTVAGDNTPFATNTFSAAGFLGGSESFVVTYSAATNWNAAAAQSQISNETFGSYIAGLDAGGVSSAADAYGVYAFDNSGDSRFDILGEVLFMTLDTDNLTSGFLFLEELQFKNFTLNVDIDGVAHPDRADFLVYDVSANAVIEQSWDVDYNDFGDAATGSWALETGDVIVLAVGASQPQDVAGWRLETMTMDIVVPEPASLGLVSIAGAGLLLFRRRRR